MSGGIIQADSYTNSAGTGAPSFPFGITAVSPTVQTFLSGAGTYTLPTSPYKPVRIVIQMVGGGGGGAGSGTSATGSGTNGTGSTFGASLLIAGGGGGGSAGSFGGAGGTNTVFAGPVIVKNLTGTAATSAVSQILAASQLPGSPGACSFLGGGGGGAFDTDGGAAQPNTGSGGAGGGTAATANVFSGSGGGSGGYLEAIISNPSATYSYSVGLLGTGGVFGTSGTNGGNGAAGQIVVTEYYQ